MTTEDGKEIIIAKEILSNRYIYELLCNGIKTDEQIEAHCREELMAKGIEI